MARHILIVDESDMMRRVLQARILSNLDDAVISGAKDIDQAAHILNNNTVHLILYGWDIQDEAGLQFCKKAASGGDGSPPIPFLLLIGDKKEHVAMTAELVGRSYLSMPCSPEALARAIDRICYPAQLRQTKRYSINNTSAVINQRQVRMESVVLNVSTGGALCEFELDPQFNSAFPVMLSMQFDGEGGPATINGLGAVATNMLVITRHEDQTSKRLRMGFKFVNLSDEAIKVFDRIFAQVEDD